MEEDPSADSLCRCYFGILCYCALDLRLLSSGAANATSSTEELVIIFIVQP